VAGGIRGAQADGFLQRPRGFRGAADEMEQRAAQTLLRVGIGRVGADGLPIHVDDLVPALERGELDGEDASQRRRPSRRKSEGQGLAAGLHGGVSGAVQARAGHVIRARGREHEEEGEQQRRAQKASLLTT
jgi:hypothetical protein